MGVVYFLQLHGGANAQGVAVQESQFLTHAFYDVRIYFNDTCTSTLHLYTVTNNFQDISSKSTSIAVTYPPDILATQNIGLYCHGTYIQFTHTHTYTHTCTHTHTHTHTHSTHMHTHAHTHTHIHMYTHTSPDVIRMCRRASC